MKSFTDPFLNKLTSFLRVPNVMNSTLLAVMVCIALMATVCFVVYLMVCFVRERLEDMKLRRRQQQCRLAYANSWNLEGFHTVVPRSGQRNAMEQDQAAVRPSNITPFVLHPEEEQEDPMPKRVAA